VHRLAHRQVTGGDALEGMEIYLYANDPVLPYRDTFIRQIMLDNWALCQITISMLFTLIHIGMEK
jgi:hypothetical protein